MLRKLLFIIGCIGAFSVAGCASTVGNKFDVSKISNIKTGISTGEDVLSLMGTPFGKNTTSTGTSTWTYQFVGTSVSMLAVYGMGTSESSQQILTVTFSKSNVVTACSYRTSSSKGSGMTGATGLGGERVEIDCKDVK